MALPLNVFRKLVFDFAEIPKDSYPKEMSKEAQDAFFKELAEFQALRFIREQYPDFVPLKIPQTAQNALDSRVKSADSKSTKKTLLNLIFKLLYLAGVVFLVVYIVGGILAFKVKKGDFIQTPREDAQGYEHCEMFQYGDKTLRRANCKPLKAQSEDIPREKAIKLKHLPDNPIYSTKFR